MRFFICIIVASWVGISSASAEASCNESAREIYEQLDGELVASVELQRCALSGHPAAETALGFVYLGAIVSYPCATGVCERVEPDVKNIPDNLRTPAELRQEYKRLLRSAAAKKDPDALNELGIDHLEGRNETDVDWQRAYGLFVASSDAGGELGPYNVARMHFAGLGVDTSEALGERYLRLSADRGYLPARGALADMRRRRTRARLGIDTLAPIARAVAEMIFDLLFPEPCEAADMMPELDGFYGSSKQ